ncbi:MAG: nitrogenase component 1 [Methanomicrobiales archaeon]|nr:nitrogenase component 1 [Methanomicrobiales archaeon]
MTLKPLPSGSRLEGCTLTGALSVSTQFRDAVTVIHGPPGCAQHNLSLFHATCLENDTVVLPRLASTDLDESGVIFGGEGALAEAIRDAAALDPPVVFVLSTCVVETIGDDTGAVCSRGWDVPVVHIPTAGFLGGVFRDGFHRALQAIAGCAGEPGDGPGGVVLVGEKNLEYEVDAHGGEVRRLLSLLGARVDLRLVRGMDWATLPRLGVSRLNVLREPDLAPLGVWLGGRFRTPYLPSYPVGLAGTLLFLARAGRILGMDAAGAVRREEEVQQEMLSCYADLSGSRVWCDRGDGAGEGAALVQELAAVLDLRVDRHGTAVPLPDPLPVGTTGIRQLLHRWRRAIHG